MQNRRRMAVAVPGAAAVLAATLLVALVTGCGSDDAGGGGGENGPQELTVGALPITASAPVYLGVDQGFFRDENLNVDVQLAQGGAAIVPAVVSGDMQFGFGGSDSVVTAVTRGLPIVAVTTGEVGGEDEESDTSAIVARKGLSIDRAQQLEGKTMAINSVSGITALATRAALEESGADPSKVKLLEVEPADTVPALADGRVDAAFLNEPLTSLALAQGHEVVLRPYSTVRPNLLVGVYFTSRDFAEENRDVVERFKRALDKSLDYAAENPDEVRRIVRTYTEFPAPAVEQMRLPTFQSGIEPADFAPVVDLSLRYGDIEQKPALEQLVWAQQG